MSDNSVPFVQLDRYWISAIRLLDRRKCFFGGIKYLPPRLDFVDQKESVTIYHDSLCGVSGK